MGHLNDGSINGSIHLTRNVKSKACSGDSLMTHFNPLTKSCKNSQIFPFRTFSSDCSWTFILTNRLFFFVAGCRTKISVFLVFIQTLVKQRSEKPPISPHFSSCKKRSSAMNDSSQTRHLAHSPEAGNPACTRAFEIFLSPELPLTLPYDHRGAPKAPYDHRGQARRFPLRKKLYLHAQHDLRSTLHSL